MSGKFAAARGLMVVALAFLAACAPSAVPPAAPTTAASGPKIVGNIIENIAAVAVVLEGDRNRVETRNARDVVRDLGSGNRVNEYRDAPDLICPHVRTFLEEIRTLERRRHDTVHVAPSSPTASWNG